jgi:integrase
MRGNGRLFRRKGSAMFYCAYYLRGVEHRESTGTPDEKLARRFLRHRLDEVGADRAGARKFVGPRQMKVTVRELLKTLEDDYRERDKLSAKAKSNFKPLREHLGAMRAVDITREVVSDMVQAWLAEGYAKATCNRRTQLLAQAFAMAVRDGKLVQTPHIGRLSEVGNERQGFFEHEDLERVVANLPEHLRDFCRFAYVTGWRKGAISSLEWPDVGEDVVTMRAVNSKNRRPTTLPLEGELRDIIERRRAASVVESVNGGARFPRWVFHSEGERIRDIRKSWARACKLAGVEGKLFHDLRRTAARNLLFAGVPQAVAMQITGHKTDAMFRRYCIQSEEQKAEGLARTSQYLELRARLSRLVRQHRLDPTLVMLYAADCCGRQLRQNFVEQLAQLAVENRAALVNRLSSYAPKGLAPAAENCAETVPCSVRELGPKASEQGQLARAAM